VALQEIKCFLFTDLSSDGIPSSFTVTLFSLRNINSKRMYRKTLVLKPCKLVEPSMDDVGGFEVGFRFTSSNGFCEIQNI